MTTFTAGAQNTLPIWIFGHIRLGQQLPQVNVVVLFVIIVTVIPVILAQRLTRDTGIMRQAGGAPGHAGGGRRCDGRRRWGGVGRGPAVSRLDVRSVLWSGTFCQQRLQTTQAAQTGAGADDERPAAPVRVTADRRS